MNIAIKSKQYYANSSYRGLYRLDPIPDTQVIDNLFKTKNKLFILWKWYIDSYYEGKGIIFNDKNIRKAKELCKMAEQYGFNQDILLYGVDSQDKGCYGGAEFLGFDVCGESMNYSYLGTGMFTQDNPCKLSPSFRVFREFFTPKLNKFLLFVSNKDAQEFSGVLNEFSKMGYSENETNWKSIAIYNMNYN